MFWFLPSVGLISIAFISPFPRAVLTTAGFNFFNSGTMISPSLAACSASFSSSKTYKNITSAKYIKQIITIIKTYWDLLTEKPLSKFLFANRCKPIKWRVSLFSGVRKMIHPIRSRVSCFLTCETYQVEVFIQGWLAAFRTQAISWRN